MSVAIAREILTLARSMADEYFEGILSKDEKYDVQFTDTTYKNIVAIGSFDSIVPAIKELYKESSLADYFDGLEPKASYLFELDWDNQSVRGFKALKGETAEELIDASIVEKIYDICKDYKTWAGVINQQGEHIINLKNPVPGPHFYTNMLLGDRMKFPYALQSTPKSVVDRFGGGSFRAHAATQVLATRWDFLPEENGFPANRQFYIIEEGKQIFYSADVMNENIKHAHCIHSQNHTVIEYETSCGLKIKRTIFLIPQYEGLPAATEVQRISIINNSHKDRKLKVVLTGMLGTSATHALMEDVVYSTVIMQGKVFNDSEGNILAYSPSYYPVHAKGDVRFTTAMVYEEGHKKYAKEVCTHYEEFVGSGNLNKPQGAAKLTNRLSTKGPGFFALGCNVKIKANAKIDVDHFVGLVSEFGMKIPSDEEVKKQLDNLHAKFNHSCEIERSLEEQLEAYKKYSTYLQVETKDLSFDTYVNKNLPFQVLYQTFVSRSFDLTQKGYREIGFREIQDIFVSMYYLVSMGEIEYTKSLLQEWIAKVLDFGYCYHNFFWKGKEAGKWSDDGLWLLQAVHRFVSYTGDAGFLDECFEIPETNGKTRSVYDTLKAVITYSLEVSVGKHGLPLIDYADWNDCLKVDETFHLGAEKEQIYKQTGKYENNQSESVMNAFLLKIALMHMIDFAKIKEDSVCLSVFEKARDDLSENIQKYAWKEDFFARVLFNRYGEEISFLGAGNDGFSADPAISGTYFLNSFSWSILAEEAKEEQIAIMLEQIEKYLKTPYGIKLMSPTDLSKVATKTATGEYFPGDRENGGIFKHATMMGTAAMIQAAKKVENRELAKKLTDRAYWMVNLVLPYHALERPFEICGNPRWCTQYNNSETGENIGPTLSGTSTWMLLTIIEMLGVSYEGNELVLSPILENEKTEVTYALRFFETYYKIHVTKPQGFYRIKDSAFKMTVDGEPFKTNRVRLKNDCAVHEISICYI